jgi:hypothetical protein
VTYPNILLITSSNGKDFSKCNPKDDRHDQAGHCNFRKKTLLRNEIVFNQEHFSHPFQIIIIIIIINSGVLHEKLTVAPLFKKL